MKHSKTRWFDTPDKSSGLGYATRFYMRVWQSLKEPESLDLNASLPPLKTHWFLSEDTARKWPALFGYEGAHPQAFTYSAPAGVWALMQVLQDLGVKFSRIMHLHTRLLLVSEKGFEVGTHYTTSVRYQGARPLKGHSVSLAFRSEVRDVTGREVMQLEDELYVGGLPDGFVDQLANNQVSLPASKADQSALLSNPLADRIPVRIPRRLGSQYGKLSGDLNPLHISSIGARLLGHSSSFIQGLCTANLILATLGNHWQQSIRSLDMRFERPVPQPARLNLVCTLDQFALVDERQKALVFGSYIC
ncbi:MAG: MaoC/PaaZ C-terminal domain-containing protein [Saccharospirillum sp.]